MAPVFGRLGKHYRGRIAFVAVNVYDRPDLAKRFGVNATPTFILVRTGKALRRFSGNIPEPLLKQHLQPYAPATEEQDTEKNSSLVARVTSIFRERR